MTFFKKSIRFALVAAVIAVALPVYAQSAKEPPLPEPLQHLAGEGAQMRYLGKKSGLDGWIAIKNGQEQYFYVTEDGQAFLMGLLFDKSGKVVTLQQVRALQESSGAEDLDLFADETLNAAKQTAQDRVKSGFDQLTDRTAREFKTPSEQLYSDMESANWISIGNPQAPYIYTFIDPQCPHCHEFMKDIRKDYLDNGLLQVRIVPVGFRDTTRAQAAFLLAVPNPEARFFSYLDGDENALPLTPGINEQGVQRNLAVMQSWKVNVTPFSVYRAKDGSVKIIQGRAQDISQIVADVQSQ